MPEFHTPATVASDAPPSTASVQILLLTYRASVLGDDIAQAAAQLALRRPGVQFVVAWGGDEGERFQQWQRDVATWQAQGADVVLLAHPVPLQRTRLALESKKDWVLPLADDDPIAVNYLRALVDATAEAGDDASAVLPSHYTQSKRRESAVLRQHGWLQADGEMRLGDMLSFPGAQGTLFWAAYRHEVIAEWLNFALSLPFQPPYLDQLLPHLAALRGRMVVAAEETCVLKDEANWDGVDACTRNNARYCPHPDMALFIEWFWAADMWRLMGGPQASPKLQLALKRWARHMTAEQLEGFGRRARVLGVKLLPAHARILETLRDPCTWLHGADEPEFAGAGMDLVALIADTLRERWVAAGAPPEMQDEAVAEAEAA